MSLQQSSFSVRSLVVSVLSLLAGASSVGAQQAAAPPAVEPASLRVSLDEPPLGGQLRVLLFDSAVTFGRFSDPARVEVFPTDGRRTYAVGDVSPGEYAVVIHHDLDADGEFGKNFIGIPTEPIAISRGYRPKGPPVWASARFELAAGEEAVLDLELFSVLGKLGLLGVGVGAVGRSSPYVGGGTGVFQPIPAITYAGDRLQWFGPTLRFGLVGSDKLRLAATANYRLRPYDDDESPALAGMTPRDDTLMAGLSVIGELPKGVNLALGYEYDTLNVIDGGVARFVSTRPWQWGIARLNPTLGLTWNSSAVANYDFGVSSTETAPGRPAYDVGSTLSFDVGLGTFWELSRNWKIVADVTVELLPSSVKNSPIVGESVAVRGFLALTYTL